MSVTDEFYVNMLNGLLKYFSKPEITKKLDIIEKYAWGFEPWFQIETLVSLKSMGVDVKTRGKGKKDADIIFYKDKEMKEDYGLELRCWKRGHTHNILLLAIEKHHINANLYLFLFKNDSDKLKEVEMRLNEIKMDGKIRDFKSGELRQNWYLMLVEK